MQNIFRKEFLSHGSSESKQHYSLMKKSLTLITSAAIALTASVITANAAFPDLSRQETTQHQTGFGRIISASETAPSSAFSIRKGRGLRPFGTVHRHSLPPSGSAAESTQHAIQVVGSLLDPDAPGVYSYTFADNAFSAIALSDDLFANGNGILADDTYISFYIEDLEWMQSVYVYKFDINTWEKTGTGYARIENVPIDMAHDPATGRIYGCFPKDASYTGFIWGQYNPDTYVKAGITEMQEPLLAVAADASGQFFGIDRHGDLYKVEKESGAKTLVGSTGLELSFAPQSAAFDLRLGHMYLSAELADGTTGLWRVNTLTGATELVNMFPGNEFLMGIYVPELKADLGAPDKVTDLTADFSGGSLKGNVKFTMPSRSYGGESLDGMLNYTIEANGEEIKRGSAMAAEHVSATVESPAGNVRFTVRTSNSAGSGPAEHTDAFVGFDAPEAVGNLSAAKDDNGHITITWTAPEATLNGGYFNPDDLTYTVRRLPDNRLIAVTSATVCSDMISGDELTTWSYEVTPKAADIEGPSCLSNAVVTGSYCTVPWSDDFSSSATFPLYTVVNVADDRYTWVYSDSYGCAMCDYDFTNPKDDWLFSPALMLDSDKTYRVRITTRSKRALPETLEVMFGNAPAVEAMSTQLIEPTVITSDDYSSPDVERTFETYVSPADDGLWHVGIHAMSDPQMNRLELHYIEVTEAGQALAPEAPSDLTVTAGENGSLTATVAFTTPTKAINGEPLESLDKAEIYVNGQKEATVDNPAPAPGSSVTVTVPTLQGDNEIRVKTFNHAGQGLEAVASVYTGVTVPGTVTDLTATYSGGRITLTWNAPQQGEDGGYVDPDAMTYMIMRSDKTLLAYDTTGTTITDDLASFSINGQGIVSYVVYPRNAAGTGYGTYSNGIVLGDGFFTLPFKESFPNGTASNTPWGISSTTETGWYMTTRSINFANYDDDNGMAVFSPHGPGESSLIYTGRFRLAGTVNPVMSFMFYNDMQQENVIEVLATSDYANWTPIGTADLSDASLPEGWCELKVSLESLIGAEPFVAFGLRGVSPQSDNWRHNLYIDCLRIYDELEHNLELIEFDTPGSIPFGQSAAFGGVVVNRGSKPASGYTIDIVAGGNVVASAEGVSLQPDAQAAFELTVTPTFEDAPAAVYQAVINYDADQNPANNVSEERNVLIVTNDYPVVTDLAGTNEDSGITLCWSAPEEGLAPELTVESFEEYTSFIIDNIGGWTLRDIDGEGGTFGITFGGTPIEFMNATYPHAYQVFNPEKCGVGSQTGLDALLPHTGEQYLVSFQDTDGENDDWLISPELSGDAQVISFFAKTPIPNYGFETFEVYYSTTDMSAESFIRVEGIKEEAFMRWEQVAFMVPEGTRHFAIRHTSRDKFLLAIDDISFVRADAPVKPLSVTGYNVYRDNIKIGSVDAGTFTFTDRTPENRVNTYAVTAVYTHGESGYSNIVELSPSSVAEIESGAIRAFAIKSGITVTGAAGKEIRLIGSDGCVILADTADSDRKAYDVSAGVYIVKAGSRTFKVIVR